jgi:ADP-heptose:LPS heptosyltransferase
MIVLTPSAAHTWKDWPVARWAAVVDEMPAGVHVVISGTSAQRDRHLALARAARRPVIDLTGKITLAELVALLARASLHVAPDSGPAHISAALGVPVVTLFGPTSAARLSPFGQRSRVIEHRGLCGAACAVNCRHQARCLAAITEDEVIAALRRTLAAATPAAATPAAATP